MSTLSERGPESQNHAVQIVEEALRVLKTRDGIQIHDDTIIERARNIIAGLEADFALVRRPPLPEALASLDDSMDGLRASIQVLRAIRRAGVA